MGLPNEIHPFLVTGNDANQYKIPYSLRIRSSNSSYLSRTPYTTGNQRKATFSFWVKRGDLGTNSGNASYLYGVRMTSSNYFWFGFGSGDEFQMGEAVTTTQWNLITNRKFRDTSAWYHIVVAIDTTQATSSNRVRLYVNGVEETSFSTASYPSLNYTHTYLGSPAYIHSLAWSGNNAVYYGANHYLAEVNHIDGQQLTPSYFGETDPVTNQWKPKRYQGLEFTPYAATSGMVTQSGLPAFTAANVVADADNVALPGACFHTDTSGVGSYLQFDLGVGNAQEFRRIRVLSDKSSGQGAIAVWNIQYSDDGSSWTTAYTNLDIQTNNANYGSTDVIPTLAVWDSVGAHRYWRLYKTNSATGGDYHRRVTFYTARMSNTPDYGMNGFYLPFTNLSTQVFGNLINYSQNLENAVWTKDRSSIGTNYFMAPDGTPTADKLIEDTTASNTHRTFINNMTLTNGTVYVFSVYAKAAQRTAFALEAWNGSTANYCYADLSTGTVISGSHASAVVTSVGNGWYRCSVTLSGAGLGGSGSAFYLMNAAVAGSFSYTGDGSSGIYFWGAQIEASTAGVPGPYRSTIGSATSTFYQVSADSSRDRYSVSNNYNNFDCYGTAISGAPTTSDYTHDSYKDTPTSYNDGSEYYNRANYATLNPLSNLNTTLNSGNLYQYYAGSWSSALATIGVTSGKWYMEAYQVAVVATNYTIIGVAYQPWATSNYLGSTSTSYGFQWTGSTSYKYFNGNGGVGVSTPGGTASAGSILQLAFDADTGNLWYGLNNTWAEGSPSAGTGASHTVSPVPGIGSVWFMGMSQYGGNASAVNFGQRPFSYTPPIGFKALNSYNLAQPSLPLV